MKEIGFHHGALCEDYEKQANEQGYTLGKFDVIANKLGFGLTINYVHGIITESEYSKALNRLQKKLIQNLRKLEKGASDAKKT